MTTFQLILKNDKKKLYQQITLFIILLNILGFIYLGFFTSIEEWKKYTALGAAALIFLFLIYKLVFRKSKFPIGAEVFFILTLLWCIQREFRFALLMLVFDILYWRTQMTFRVIFSNENILYPSFPKKKLAWDKLTNVVLKDGLLTIDLKNNKLIQQLVDESASSVNEKEFNEFCQQQLSIARQETITN